MEFLLRRDVVVHDGGSQGAHFATCGGEPVSGGTNGSWVDFGGHKEGDGVGAELVEERGEKVHGLERRDVCLADVVLVVEAWNDEEDKVHEKAKHLHLFAAIEFVVDKEGWGVISQRHILGTGEIGLGNLQAR